MACYSLEDFDRELARRARGRLLPLQPKPPGEELLDYESEDMDTTKPVSPTRSLHLKSDLSNLPGESCPLPRRLMYDQRAITDPTRIKFYFEASLWFETPFIFKTAHL